MSVKNRSVYATLPRTQRGMPLVLGGDPKGKNFLYCNGNSVIIRDIVEPSISDIYTEHSVETNVAKYSPSGFYIASADKSGKVRIWDTINKEHILKNEYQPFVGPVKDLSWSSDGQRIVVVGEGRERFGHVFMAETGTSVGEIAGHSNLINSVDFRPTRPFRIITGSEDNTINVYEGPPFKYTTTLSDHTRFVQSVRFHPQGNTFASGGFDGKMFLYDTNTYSRLNEFGSPAHSGGIYSIAWTPDGTKVISASGDKTCKLWDVETLTSISTFKFGNDVLDQQVSCLSQGQHLLSVSLSGFINYLDVNNPSKPLRVVKGHNKSITALGVSPDRSTLFTGSHDGFITYWDPASGQQDRVLGDGVTGHNNQVQDMSANSTSIYTCALDDTVKSINLANNQFSTTGLKLDSQPRGVAAGNTGTVVVACLKEIVVVVDGQKKSALPVTFEPSCVSLHPQENDVAIGGNDNKSVQIYLLSGSTLSMKTSMEHTGGITDVSYSPNGVYLAASDANRKVVLYIALTYELAHNLDWCFHTARVNSLAWSPDSTHLVSGSLDTNIIIWSTENPGKHITVKKAHPQSQITRIEWLDNNTIVTTGQDSNVKIWEVTY